MDLYKIKKGGMFQRLVSMSVIWCCWIESYGDCWVCAH